MLMEFCTQICSKRGWIYTCFLPVVAMILAGPSPVLGQRRFPYAYDNQAPGKESYMVRLTDSLPPAAYGNDNNLSTIVLTTERSVDGYWEVDLEQEYAVYHVQVDAADGFGDRMTHATVRLFDENHDSVFSQLLDDIKPPVFYVNCGGPRRARYVRVGFEHKERSSPTGGIEWYLGLKEVMVIGRPAEEVGLFSLASSANQIAGGEAVTLVWSSEDASTLTLYPDVGVVTSLTDSQGMGTITLSPERSTEYMLVVEGAFGREIQALTVTVDDQALSVFISEFVARNRLSLEDGYENSPDWIELCNPTETVVNLTGYALSDDPNEPLKWHFPDVNIPAHGFLIVYASGQDHAFDPQGGIHADWRLDADGESLLLTAPDGTVLDQVLDYPAQAEDLAYGRDIMQGDFRFQDPTPGSVNLMTQSYEGWLSPLVFSHERGFYDTVFDLSLHHDDPEAEIRMSLNGGVPNTIYRHGVSVSGTRTVRASALRPGFKSPPVQTHTYVNVRDVLKSPVMNTGITQNRVYADRVLKGLTDLPSLAIAVPTVPDDYRERSASVELLWPDGQSAVQADCGMVRYGGAWTSFAKKNYRLKFRKRYGTPKFRAPLFRGFDRGFPAVERFDELELGGGSHDMNQRGFYMSARFVEDTMLDMGSLNPHGRFVHLYINGTYWGQFHLRERLVEHFLADYLGGKSEDYMNVRGNDNVGSSFIPGTPDPVSRYSWQCVRALAGSFRDVQAYLDVPGLIDFMLLWFYGNCESEYRASGPIEVGSGFKFWLADADGYLRAGGNRTSNAGPGGLFGALVAEGDPDFMDLLANRIYRHLAHDGALTSARTTERLLERMTEIQDSLIAECARWGFRTPGNWEEAAANIIDTLFPLRASQLLSYLRSRGLYPAFDPPQYNQQGGPIGRDSELILSASGGTIYYTLDGSDPRLPKGGIAPTALVYHASGSSDPLVTPGSLWRYWDKGGMPVGGWSAPDYNDTAWARGRAQLGYGDGDEATVVGYGPESGNKYITTYFRRAFVVDDVTDLSGLTLQLLCDDGALVYLNGAELWRENMPVGIVGPETRAASGVGGSDESQWFVHEFSSGRLVSGTNVLAVELHQTGPSSSDISFDLALEARRSQDHESIPLRGDTMVKSRVFRAGQWSALSEAGFVVYE